MIDLLLDAQRDGPLPTIGAAVVVARNVHGQDRSEGNAREAVPRALGGAILAREPLQTRLVERQTQDRREGQRAGQQGGPGAKASVPVS